MTVDTLHCLFAGSLTTKRDDESTSRFVLIFFSTRFGDNVTALEIV